MDRDLAIWLTAALEAIHDDGGGGGGDDDGDDGDGDDDDDGGGVEYMNRKSRKHRMC
jgi:hypothetical protein